MYYGTPSALIGWGAIQHNHNWANSSVIANNKAYGRTMATTITPTWQDVNRINYFTPRFQGLQIGVGYAPKMNGAANNGGGLATGPAGQAGVCGYQQAANPNNCTTADYSYQDLFARLVRAYGKPGDVAIGLTTSGNSENVLRGLEAARKLGFSASHTMRVAQNLYEAGAITYMRTDGVQMDSSAISAARKAISDRYNNGHYLPEKPRHYETKAKNAQEAHEAIRPTDFGKDHYGSGDEARLYELVWKRAIASQMASALIERTSVTLRDGTGKHELRATGQVIKFPGFLAVYDETLDQKPGDDEDESAMLPVLNSGDTPAKRGVEASQHFTQPPPRYSEATLVKRLEELGIGRPSTYAATIQVLKDRAYVRVEKNRFIPEESGRLLTAFLERFFNRYVEYDFTAGLEEELDDVSGGRAQWQAVLERFWRDFKPRTGEVMEQKPSEITAALDEFLGPYLFPDKGDGSNPRTCPKCGTGQLSLKLGKFGSFIGCSNYPDCRYTRPMTPPAARFTRRTAFGVRSSGALSKGVVLVLGSRGSVLEGLDLRRSDLKRDEKLLVFQFVIRTHASHTHREKQ